MKRCLVVLTVALAALSVLVGCNDYNNSIQNSTGGTISTVSPSFISAGSVTGTQTLMITVIASSLSSVQFPTTGAFIEWNNTKLTTTYVDASTLTAQVPASFVAKPGTALVGTLIPQSGTGMNGLSNTLPFVIYGAPNPVPTLTSVSPGSAATCSSTKNCPSLSITLTGTNFLSASNNGGSVVTFTGQATTNQQPTAITINSLSSTQIKATIPGTFLMTADPTATINVQNPGSGSCQQSQCQTLVGGGPSTSPWSFPITGTGAQVADKNAGLVAEETPGVSQDGRYVVFSSEQGENSQIMLRDTCVGAPSGCTPATRVVSAAQDGTAGNGDSHNPVITADGRYVAYSSAASNLVEGAPTGRQVYVQDTCLGADGSCKPATTLISTDPAGALTGTESILPSISTSGRYVAFLAITAANGTKTGAAGTSAGAGASSSTKGIPNSGLRQVFVRDTCLGATGCTPKTTRISLEPGDASSNATSNATSPAGPAISGLAKQIAMGDAKISTVFTTTVPVDDRVFLAIPAQPK
jgi:WD40-like Beta Propeller Repeat